MMNGFALLVAIAVLGQTSGGVGWEIDRTDSKLQYVIHLSSEDLLLLQKPVNPQEVAFPVPTAMQGRFARITIRASNLVPKREPAEEFLYDQPLLIQDLGKLSFSSERALAKFIPVSMVNQQGTGGWGWDVDKEDGKLQLIVHLTPDDVLGMTKVGAEEEVEIPILPILQGRFAKVLIRVDPSIPARTPAEPSLQQFPSLVSAGTKPPTSARLNPGLVQIDSDRDRNANSVRTTSNPAAPALTDVAQNRPFTPSSFANPLSDRDRDAPATASLSSGSTPSSSNPYSPATTSSNGLQPLAGRNANGWSATQTPTISSTPAPGFSSPGLRDPVSLGTPTTSANSGVGYNPPTFGTAATGALTGSGTTNLGAGAYPNPTSAYGTNNLYPGQSNTYGTSSTPLLASNGAAPTYAAPQSAYPPNSNLAYGQTNPTNSAGNYGAGTYGSGNLAAGTYGAGNYGATIPSNSANIPYGTNPYGTNPYGTNLYGNNALATSNPLAQGIGSPLTSGVSINPLLLANQGLTSTSPFAHTAALAQLPSTAQTTPTTLPVTSSQTNPSAQTRSSRSGWTNSNNWANSESETPKQSYLPILFLLSFVVNLYAGIYLYKLRDRYRSLLASVRAGVDE